MKCIQLNNPRSNKMPNVFISTATLDARDQASQAKPNQSKAIDLPNAIIEMYAKRLY